MRRSPSQLPAGDSGKQVATSYQNIKATLEEFTLKKITTSTPFSYDTKSILTSFRYLANEIFIFVLGGTTTCTKLPRGGHRLGPDSVRRTKAFSLHCLRNFHKGDKD